VPEVSVILPAYRAAAHIAAALDSVFAQTFSSFEVIVVNDGSPDTPALVTVLAPYAPRLQYLRMPVNRGAAVARNAGIADARGRYVAFLDADDCWSPVFLQTQVAYLESHPSCDLVFADADRGSEVRSTSRRQGHDAASGPVTLLSLVQQSCKIALPTVVVRRETILTVGLFDEGLRRGQDFDLWLRLALRGTVMEHQHITLARRQPSSESPSGDAVAELERALSVLERFGHRHLLDAATRTALRIRTMQLIDRLEIEQGKLRILEGNFAAAQYHLAATRERPLRLRLAVVALQVAPRLVRAIYARARGAHWGHSRTLAPSSR
jgi:glycosyltransferase involved in cell wall biosynthesis